MRIVAAGYRIDALVVTVTAMSRPPIPADVSAAFVPIIAWAIDDAGRATPILADGSVAQDTPEQNVDVFIPNRQGRFLRLNAEGEDPYSTTQARTAALSRMIRERVPRINTEQALRAAMTRHVRPDPVLGGRVRGGNAERHPGAADEDDRRVDEPERQGQMHEGAEQGPGAPDEVEQLRGQCVAEHGYAPSPDGRLG
jgi:hypothetical protein